MALLDELTSASYKGVGFLISKSSTTGGRKDQLHEFPNSDKQTIEDLGLLPRVFNIVGIISGTDYIQKRDALLAALESDTPGVMVHPFYGSIENIKARSFTIVEDLTDLGRAEITMIFTVSDSIGNPEESENTLALLDSDNDSLQASVGDSIADTWEVDTGFSGNFSAAQGKLEDLKDGYNTATDLIVKSTDKINEYNALITDFGNDINELILEPRALADSIVNLGQNISGLYSTAEQQIEAWKDLFSFGDIDLPITETTAGLTQRNANNKIINDGIQAQALSYAYLAMSQITYSTTDELDETFLIMENQFDKVVASETLDQTVRENLDSMRENTNTFFNQVRSTLNQIITISTPEIPARALAFQYYGESDLGESLASLNVDANVSFLAGDIEVLTQ